MGILKSLLARLCDRFPVTRIFYSAFISWLLTLRIRSYVFRLFGFKPPSQGTLPGQLEQQVLEMVKHTTPQGNAQAVLEAIDSYNVSGKVPLIDIGDIKGALVESVLEKYKPQVALELGSYIGYSAIVTARKLPPGGKLYGIDLNPINVRVAREMVQHAGLSDRVEIIEGTLETSIPELRKQRIQTIGYTLIDHEGRFFLNDLLILQQSGLLKKGSVVVTDNILIPGAPEYRKYLASSPNFLTKEHVCRFSFSDFLVDIVAHS